MYIIKKNIEIDNKIDFEMISDKKRLVFFDIETTGLSPSHAQLYLIGLLHYTDEGWSFMQLFSESMEDEEEMLATFRGFLINKAKECGQLYLVSYNGDTFDIPFLEKCAAQYQLNMGFENCISLDLIKKVRGLKKLLGLPDCKLKTVEKYLGIYREDMFNGGELIELYREFVELKQRGGHGNQGKLDALLKVLLLHNEEDIANMPYLVDFLAYEALREGSFEIEKCSIEQIGDSATEVLDVELRLDHSLPRELYIEDGPFVISISQSGGRSFSFTAALVERELKYFFADYKDYYYLVLEDYAVHKSVGEFVDRSSRKQATRKTAYIRKTGRFLEQPEEIYSPAFSEEYNSKTKYALFTQELLQDEQRLKKYITAVITAYIKRK